MKRLIQRVAALTAALCVAAACVAPVYAETANTEKEENVYVNFCRAFCVKSWASTGLSSPTRHTWWASQEKCGAASSCPLPCRAAAI